MTRYEIIAVKKRLFRKKLKVLQTHNLAVTNQYLNVPQGYREFTITFKFPTIIYDGYKNE